MSTTTIIEQKFISADGKTLVVSYDPIGNVAVKLEIVVNGERFRWSTVEDMKDFMTNMVSAINLVHSTSGTGAGYIAATVGTDSTVDPIVD